MLKQIAKRIQQRGGRAFLVGGCVRDQFFGRESKDLDVEVFGLEADELLVVLSEFGTPKMAGASFSVFKMRVGEDDFDFSLPRRDSKVGAGHKGFVVKADPHMSQREAARRRDFTFSALAQDVLTGEVFDFFGGVADIAQRRLQVTDPETFVDDPLRVLRGMQFCGRFGLTATARTVVVCSEMVEQFAELPVERVWEEWHKWATRSVAPSMGLEFLKETGWLTHFPELDALVGVEQDPRWHPEGDVWSHTCQVVDQATGAGEAVMFAALLHDTGKPATTVTESGRVTSRGHAEAGEETARSFMERVGAPRELTEKVVRLVGEHMRHPTTRSGVRRLAQSLAPATVTQWGQLVRADVHGRGSAPVPAHPAWVPVEEMAAEMDVAEQAPSPVLMGRHLLEMGFAPGPAMGQFLRQAFEAQLDGVFESVEEARVWAAARM